MNVGNEPWCGGKPRPPKNKEPGTDGGRGSAVISPSPKSYWRWTNDERGRHRPNRGAGPRGRGGRLGSALPGTGTLGVSTVPACSPHPPGCRGCACGDFHESETQPPPVRQRAAVSTLVVQAGRESLLGRTPPAATPEGDQRPGCLGRGESRAGTAHPTTRRAESARRPRRPGSAARPGP